ncbi:MAG: LysR family transcriptional regulator [Symbiobacteriia bacterium]
MLLQHLETFCRVVEEGGVTAAAQSLNMSQPAVTKQLRSLEDVMKSKLLERKGRRPRLTPAGELVYDYAKRIQHLLRECRTGVEALEQPGKGLVTIGAVLTLALFTLPDLLADYTRRHPLVKVHVKTGTILQTVQMLLRGEIDLGFSTSPVNHDEVECIPLFRDPVVVISAPQAKLPKQLAVAHLNRLPMISFQKASKFRAFLDHMLEQYGIRPQITMEFDSHEAVKTMVGLGFGVAMIPYSSVRDDLAQGRLMALGVEGLPEISRMTSLLLRRERSQQPAVAAFIELTRRRFPAAAAAQGASQAAVAPGATPAVIPPLPVIVPDPAEPAD